MTTPAHVQVLLTKLQAYVEPAVVDYQNKMAFLAEVIWPATYKTGDAILKNGADNAERLIALNDLDTGNAAAGICPFEISRLYEESAGYSGTGPLTRQAAIDSMNAGFGLVTHIGHVFRYTMSLGDASLTNLQAAALTNSARPFFLVMLNCTASAYDFPCLAEQFILNPHGGAVGVLGAAREAVPDGSQLYLEAWFRSLFDSDRVSVGLALHEARLELLASSSVEGVSRWTNLITVYLGDPTLSPWRYGPRQATVTHATGLVPGTQQLGVQVTTTAGAAPGATVCLWKSGDFYAVARTNASGMATLAFRAESPGDATLSVQGAGLAPHAETVSFGFGVGPILRATPPRPPGCSISLGPPRARTAGHSRTQFRATSTAAPAPATASGGSKITNTTTLCTSAAVTTATTTNIVDCGSVTNVPSGSAQMALEIGVTGTATCNVKSGGFWIVKG